MLVLLLLAVLLALVPAVGVVFVLVVVVVVDEPDDSDPSAALTSCSSEGILFEIGVDLAELLIQRRFLAGQLGLKVGDLGRKVALLGLVRGKVLVEDARRTGRSDW